MDREQSTSCKSYDGINTSLIDGILTAATLLRNRMQYPADVCRIEEAVLDLSCDPDFKWLVNLAKEINDEALL